MKQFKYSINDDLILTTISIVDAPAVESNFHCFSKVQSFQVEGNNIVGCILRCNYPILRSGKDGFYEIVFDKAVCDHFLKQILSDTSFIDASLDHNGVALGDRVTLTGIFQKSQYVHIDDDCENGSVYAQFKVNDPQLLQDIKEGKFHGFSVEIFYDNLEEYSKLPVDKALELASSVKSV